MGPSDVERGVWRAESPMISIAQGKRSDTLGIMCRVACAL